MTSIGTKDESMAAIGNKQNDGGGGIGIRINNAPPAPAPAPLVASAGFNEIKTNVNKMGKWWRGGC